MTLFAALAIRHDMASVIVTHAPEEARRLATRTLTLSGTPAQITADVLTHAPA
jgi:ABC-type nitrate/sulfonate/bicarbonate transport system ATPase subunit